jgi:hypothetical protein
MIRIYVQQYQTSDKSCKQSLRQKKSTACLDFPHPKKFNKNQSLAIS